VAQRQHADVDGAVFQNDPRAGRRFRRQRRDPPTTNHRSVLSRRSGEEDVQLDAPRLLRLCRQPVDTDRLISPVQTPELPLVVQVSQPRTAGGVVEAADALVVDDQARVHQAETGRVFLAVVQHEVVGLHPILA